MYNAKNRFFAFLGLIFFLLLSLTISFFAFQEFFKYFNSLPAFIFSAWTIFVALSPLVIIPFLLMIIPVIIFGRQIKIELGKKLFAFSLASLVLMALIMLVFSFIYKASLSNRGYVECTGTPTGWTPGMATKYALTRELCDTRDR